LCDSFNKLTEATPDSLIKMAAAAGLVGTLLMHVCTNYEAIMNSTQSEGKFVRTQVKYRVFAERRNRLTLLPSDCALEKPTSCAGKKEVGVIANMTRIS
jgi:hypothetical protein